MGNVMAIVWVLIFVTVAVYGVISVIGSIPGISSLMGDTTTGTEAPDGRFAVSSSSSASNGGSEQTIITDKETGVQYLYVESGSENRPTGGLTVLVGRDGKPLIDPEYAGDNRNEDISGSAGSAGSDDTQDTSNNGKDAVETGATKGKERNSGMAMASIRQNRRSV